MQEVLPAALVELPGRAGERPTPSWSARPPRCPGSKPSRAGRHKYQSRFGDAGSRDSTNHGCSSEVWLTTRSMTSLMPRSCSAGDQLVQLLQRAEQRVDVLVVADVVAVVVHRRAVDRRQPDHVDAQLGQVVQPLGDAGDVAGPVAVAVGERPRIDLVDHRGLPPVVGPVDGDEGLLSARSRSRIDPSTGLRVARSAICISPLQVGPGGGRQRAALAGPEQLAVGQSGSARAAGRPGTARSGTGAYSARIGST